MKTLFFLSTFFFSCLRTMAQAEADSSLISCYQHVVQTLSHDSMQGRPPGTVFEKKSASFIATQFSKSNLASKLHKFSFRPPDSSSVIKSMNVYCFINNNKDSTILIGAHYDHLGLGGPLSMSVGKKGVHNGADDNASGIALMMGLAREFKSWGNPNYNYVFVAYSAHEVGLFGSTAFAKLALKKFKKISLVVNLDMVGRMHPSERWVKITGSEQAVGVDKLPRETAGFKYRLEPDTLLNYVDTRGFYQKGIECISISTGIHDDYHKLTDDESHINYEGILLIQKWLQKYLKNTER